MNEVNLKHLLIWKNNVEIHCIESGKKGIA